MENAKIVKDRTYSQVTVVLDKHDVNVIKNSAWFEPMGLFVEIESYTDNDLINVQFYAYGLGRNLFTQRLIQALVLTFRSKL